MASASAEAQCDLPKNVIKRIVKEKLSSGDAGVKDLQINKEALLAFGESAKVRVCACLVLFSHCGLAPR